MELLILDFESHSIKYVQCIQILEIGGNFIILHIEGHSNELTLCSLIGLLILDFESHSIK